MSSKKQTSLDRKDSSVVGEIFEGFREDLHTVPDVYVKPDIPVEKVNNARGVFGIDIHETVYFLADHTFWGSAENSLVMSELGMYYHYEDNFQQIRWGQIHHAKLIEDRIVFYADPDEESYDDRWRTSMLSPSYTANEQKYFEALLGLFNTIGKNVEDAVSRLYAQIEQAKKQGNWADVVAIGGEILEHYPLDLLIHRWMSHGYLQRGNTKDAMRVAGAGLQALRALADERAITSEVQQKHHSELLTLYGEAELAENQPYEAIWSSHFADVTVPAEANERKKRIQKNLETSLTRFRDRFFDIPESDRRVVLFTNEFPNSKPDEILVVHREYMPEVQFPVGRHLDEELYVAHPYKKNVYLPFSSHEEFLFREKYMELCYLAQALGAKEIAMQGSTKQIREVLENGEVGAGGNANTVVANAEANHMKVTASDSHRAKGFAGGINQTFERTDEEPHVPDGLVWFRHQTNWQQLAEQRLAGGIITHSITFTTQDVHVVGDHRREKIAAELKKLDLGVSASTIESQNRQERQKWSSSFQVDVRFYGTESESDTGGTPTSNTTDSVRDISKAESPSANPYIDDYTEMLVDALEDGVVSPDERRMLDRMRERWEISEERARELEEEIRQRAELKSDESEYLEEVEFCLREGEEITEDERRLLDRRAQQLGLDDERAEEIEDLAKSRLSVET